MIEEARMRNTRATRTIHNNGWFVELSLPQLACKVISVTQSHKRECETDKSTEIEKKRKRGLFPIFLPTNPSERLRVNSNYSLPYHMNM